MAKQIIGVIHFDDRDHDNREVDRQKLADALKAAFGEGTFTATISDDLLSGGFTFHPPE